MNGSETIAYFDQSGDFVRDAFWRLSVPISLCDGTAAEELGFADEIQFALHPRPDSLFHAEVLTNWKEIRECPANSRHITRRELFDVEADLFGGPEVSDFIVDVNDAGIVVTQRLVDLIRKSDLIGVNLMPIQIKVNQSSFAAPALFMLTSKGPTCIRERIVRTPVPNHCPHCGWGPIVCPGCGDFAFHCEGCSLQLVVSSWDPAGTSDIRWRVEPVCLEDFIVDTWRWDGRDFVDEEGRRFVTKRLVDYLFRWNASPFVVSSLRVDIRNLSNEQRRAIDAAQSPMT
jgi:hypothetical protein